MHARALSNGSRALRSPRMITLIISIALVGLVVWAVTTYIPMPPPFKAAIYVLATVGLLLYLLNYFGVWHGDLFPAHPRR